MSSEGSKNFPSYIEVAGMGRGRGEVREDVARQRYYSGRSRPRHQANEQKRVGRAG